MTTRVVENYSGQQGTSIEDLARMLEAVLQNQQKQAVMMKSLSERLDRVTDILEEKDARRRNRIIRQHIPARFMREGTTRHNDD